MVVRPLLKYDLLLIVPTLWKSGDGGNPFPTLKIDKHAIWKFVVSYFIMIRYIVEKLYCYLSIIIIC